MTVTSPSALEHDQPRRNSAPFPDTFGGTPHKGSSRICIVSSMHGRTRFSACRQYVLLGLRFFFLPRALPFTIGCVVERSTPVIFTNAEWAEAHQ